MHALYVYISVYICQDTEYAGSLESMTQAQELSFNVGGDQIQAYTCT